MAVPITVKGAAVERGNPVPLFPLQIVGGGTDVFNRPQYDVAAGGRFLINVPTEDSSAAPITLLQNWKPPRAVSLVTDAKNKANFRFLVSYSGHVCAMV